MQPLLLVGLGALGAYLLTKPHGSAAPAQMPGGNIPAAPPQDAVAPPGLTITFQPTPPTVPALGTTAGLTVTNASTGQTTATTGTALWYSPDLSYGVFQLTTALGALPAGTKVYAKRQGA